MLSVTRLRRYLLGETGMSLDFVELGHNTKHTALSCLEMLSRTLTVLAALFIHVYIVKTSISIAVSTCKVWTMISKSKRCWKRSSLDSPKLGKLRTRVIQALVNHHQWDRMMRHGSRYEKETYKKKKLLLYHRSHQIRNTKPLFKMKSKSVKMCLHQH